ncbi:DUF997 family protein [Ferrimonas balearica]|nr:DUF997 family protein [Ferrimonas balearica]MBW3140263.1 DUF997 family protein [Ferrimonas balearica]MBW3166273.1 DUF997 family protein [Ferrimonas balearica]MBY5979853.1 DUF997 family protein [Ferrimonas balearica]MBY6106628.1 DUF997 family protein [Ferrimonas balearica]MBY6224815.1 DUF997 family protein [Ferrimonas balearica]
MDNKLAGRLAAAALVLTLLYFVLWLCGPLFFANAGLWLGLPAWFWLSCVAAPVVLLILLFIWMGGTRG